jgi:hypothetical protein
MKEPPVNMDPLDFARPRQIDLLAAERVDAIIEHECRELANLRNRAMTATATAADLERRLADERIDPDTAGWMLVRMQRFVRDLVAEDGSETSAILATARRDAARAPQLTNLSVPVVDAVRPRLPDVPMDDQADRAIADSRTTVRWAATFADATSSIPTASVPTARPAMVSAAPSEVVVAHDPAPYAAAPVVPVSIAPSPESGPAMAAEPDFWPDGMKQSRRRRFRRPSVAATLEVSAASAAVLAAIVHFT